MAFKMKNPSPFKVFNTKDDNKKARKDKKAKKAQEAFASGDYKKAYRLTEGSRFRQSLRRMFGSNRPRKA